MRKGRVLAVLTVAVLCLVGCFEVDQEYTLNPDGSGKVVHKVRQPDVMGQGDAGLKNLLQSQMTGAKGVDAWSDISVETTSDGSHLFTGTAYFNDLNSLELEDADAFRFQWLPASGGAHRLELRTMDGESGSTPSSSEVAAEVEKARSEWNQMKPMMQGIFGSFKWRASFNLPANVTDVASLETSGPSTVIFSLTGDRYFEVIEELMNDEAFLQEQARQGNLGSLSPENEGVLPEGVSARLFGEDGVYAVTASSAKPLFDYDSAVAGAEADFESMMTSLPVDAPKTVLPPAQGGDFRSLKIISTGFVTDGDLAWQKEGASLTIAGDLPGSVITMDDGVLQSALSDNGTNLLPDEEWDRQISVSLDSEDPSKVKFDVSTLLPPDGAKGFREISGVLYYKTAAEPDEEVELFSRLETGARSTQYGAVLGEFSSGYSEGYEQIEVEIGLPREEISELVWTDPQGNALDAQLVSTSWSDDSTTLTYSLEGSFPREGKARLKVRKGMTTYSIPFKVTNVDLAGRPMK